MAQHARLVRTDRRVRRVKAAPGVKELEAAFAISAPNSIATKVARHAKTEACVQHVGTEFGAQRRLVAFVM